MGSRGSAGGRAALRGTPQGGVISPLLANLYMNRFLKYWRITGRGEVFRAQVVTYADDFVILSCGCAAEALDWTRSVMTQIGLTLNEAKTSVKQARRERFDFLGYSFGPHRMRTNGREYLGASLSKKSVSKLRQKVGDLAGALARVTVDRGVTGSPESHAAWVVELLRVRDADEGLSSGRPVRLPRRSGFLTAPAQGGFLRHDSPLGCSCIRDIGRAGRLRDVHLGGLP